jgi:hypothetical protein
VIVLDPLLDSLPVIAILAAAVVAAAVALVFVIVKFRWLDY